MSYTFSVLVVANRTADSPQLLDAMRKRADRGPARFFLLAPASGGRDAAGRRLEAGLEAMRSAGLRVEGAVGHSTPIDAVADVWDPKRFDEVIVSTLAPSESKWATTSLPQRVARLTNAPVTHVAAAERPTTRHPPGGPAPVHHERHGILETLFYGGVGKSPPSEQPPPAASKRSSTTTERSE